MTTNDDTTGRFEVTAECGGYRVRDRASGKALRFSYDRKSLPLTSDDLAPVWQNFYSARGFAQKMSRLHPSR